MAISNADESTRETRLNEILAAYLQARQRGEAPDREALAAQHPEYANDLASFFADQDRFQQAAGPIKFAAGAEEPTLAPSELPGQCRPVSPKPAAGFGETRLHYATGQHVRYFGDYEIIEEIARGGMGVVYRARQVNLKRIVALKMVLAGQLATPQEIQRFYAEAEAAAKLAHPNIVPIFEVGQHEQQHYFSMAFVDGDSLAHRIAGGVLEPREAAGLMKDVASAIAYAHVEGVIHRDLKPGNILVDKDGTPRVTDFGLAKRVEGEASGLTVTGQVLGTPSYMPPEQARGDSANITQLSDVYSLGAVLYCLVTGRPPFQAASALETLLQVMEREPLSPRQLNPAVPLDLETIILKCLEKEPSRRYASAQHLVDELIRFLDGQPILARPVSAAERSWRWCRRNPVIAGLSAAVVLVLMAGTAISMFFAVVAYAQARRAFANADRADAKTKEAQRHLYAAHMNLAQSAWEDARIAQTTRLLEQYRPAAESEGGAEDLRGFEWFYWHRLCHRELNTLAGHTGVIWSVAFSPDGARLATGSNDQTVKVWDAAAGRETMTLSGHSGVVWSVAFSPNGTRIASGSADQSVKLWDAATGQTTATLKSHTGPVRCVAFSPDGGRIASASNDTTVKLWDAGTGKEITTLRGHALLVTSVAFSPDGARIVSASGDKTVKVWDPATGKATLTLTGHTALVWSAAFSPDGTRIASGSNDHTVKVWDAATGREMMTLAGHANPVRSVAFSPGGTRIASASIDQTVQLWDAATGRPLWTLKGHANRVESVAFSPDNTRIASTSSDRNIKIWDAIRDHEAVTLQGHQEPILGIAISPDGAQIASACRDQTVKLWDAGTGQEMRTLRGHSALVWSVAFSPDGKQIASSSYDGTAKLWDAATGQLALTLKHTGIVEGVAFSPDSRQIASASGDQTVKLWDAATGQEIRTLKGHTDGVTSVAFSRDGKWIASGSNDRSVKLWDAATGQELRTFKGHTDPVKSVAFSPHGARLASASNDRTIRLWDAATGENIRTSRGHTDHVLSVAFSPDGKRIVSASVDQTVKLWDAATGQETTTLKQHTDVVTSVAFSTDGARIAAASWDRTATVWDTRPRTPAMKIQHEALRLLRLLADQSIGQETLLQNVRNDPSISDAVRKQTLVLAEARWPREERLDYLTTERKQGNLLRSGSFEDPADNRVWIPNSWRLNPRAAALQDVVAKDGNRCVLLATEIDDDVVFTQGVVVQRYTDYLLSGWVKTEGVKFAQGGRVGASLSIFNGPEHSRSLAGDSDWTYLAVKFNSGQRTKITVAARLGHHFSSCTGKAWFDDLCLIPLGSREPAIP